MDNIRIMVAVTNALAEACTFSSASRCHQNFLVLKVLKQEI